MYTISVNSKLEKLENITRWLTNELIIIIAFNYISLIEMNTSRNIHNRRFFQTLESQVLYFTVCVFQLVHSYSIKKFEIKSFLSNQSLSFVVHESIEIESNISNGDIQMWTDVIIQSVQKHPMPEWNETQVNQWNISIFWRFSGIIHTE